MQPDTSSASSASSLKKYDIFKNVIHDRTKVNAIQTILANLAVGDTSHDIDKKDKGVLGITANLRNSETIQAKMYKAGIPITYNDVLTEEDAISSVVNNATFEWEVSNSSTDAFKQTKYVPLTIMKYIKEGIHPIEATARTGAILSEAELTKHNFQTINGNDYVVTYFDVKPLQHLITAQTFFTNMGYDPSILTTPKNIAFVVDCTSITIEEILNKGNQLNENFRTYLIKSSEGENDPGGKTNLQDKSFKSNTTGVRYRAAVPYNLNKAKSYNYSYEINGDGISPYTQFFTNYSFNLSELQFDDKYIFSSLSTTINITHPDRNKRIPTKTVLNSGYMNEIATVSNVVRNVLAKIIKFGNKYSDIDTFDYNCALQQKRSGDWLQALLCCLVALEERQFCEYNSPAFSLETLFKKKQITDGTAGSAVLKFEQDDVYLVTHDRILLAFALLLGINVIFTHHYKSTRQPHSFHSALVYKIKNPLETSQSKKKVMTQFLISLKGTTGQPTFSTQLIDDTKQLSKVYNRFKKHIERFKTGVQLDDTSPETEDNLNNHITKFKNYINAVDSRNGITADTINEKTRLIFSCAFKIALLRTTFPDLDCLEDYIAKLNMLLTNVRTYASKLAGNVTMHPKEGEDDFTVATNYFLRNDDNDNGDTIGYDDIVKFLTEYNEISNRLKVIKKVFNDFGKYVENMEKGLKKNPSFGLILAWRTSNVPKCNLWVQYNNVLNINSAFINDKNIFLYELTKLDDDLKSKICKVYYELFEKIKIPVNITGAPALQAKIQQNVLSFCLEVFINLGPFVDDNADIKQRIDDFLTSTQTLLDRPMSDNEFFKPDRFNKVIEELNALNSTKEVSGDATINDVSIPGDPVVVYDPVVIPNLIEDLIELVDLSASTDVASRRLDEIVAQNDDTNPNLTMDLSIDRINTGHVDNVLFEPPSPPRQAGGNRKKAQDISFIFQNKMAPRYLVVTNLFAKRRDMTEEIINNIIYRLSDSYEIRRHELPPDNRAEEEVQPDIYQNGGRASEEIDTLLSSDESILVNEKFSPHPLLSIYLILESYCTELNVTSIEDTWDYEIFIQFFVLTTKMINALLKIYSREKKNNTNELKACMVGYGLRELIFTSHQYIERDPICTESLNIELNNYNPLSKMFSIFVNRVCGSVNQTPEDMEFGSKYISSPIFREYAREIQFNDILVSNVSQVNTYELALKAQQLFLEVGNKIMADANNIENNDLLDLTSIELPYLTETTVIAPQHMIEIPNPNLKLDNKNKGNNINDYYKQLPKANANANVNNTVVYGGNKRTKNKKQYVKNKLTRRKAKIYKNRTIKRKLNKKLNKRSKRKMSNYNI
jgi:hypothetical protein